MYNRKKIFFNLVILFISTSILFAQKPATNNFWSHKYSMLKDVKYGEDEAQRMDVFLQGSWIGEPHYFKPASSKRPTLVYIHGGGWISGEKETRMGVFLHYLERGWNVLNVEYRIGANTAPAAAEDALSVLDWLVDNAHVYNLDLNNIVLSGESAGGHLALMAGMMSSTGERLYGKNKQKLPIKAIINWFGVADLAAFQKYEQSTTTTKFLKIWTGGDETTLKTVLNKYSPIKYMSKDCPPILSIHGTDDSIVPHNQAVLLHKTLDKYKIKNKLVSLKGGKHMGFTDAQFQEIYGAIFSFLSID